MKERLFRFKQFAVLHGKSAMKVGFDAVVLGCWADVATDRRILDVGSGCGVISLICAQRNNRADIFGIDIDSDSVAESLQNYRLSPWADRLSAYEISFNEFVVRKEVDNFDHIISNPPFFSAGIDCPDSPRLQARHANELSPLTLIYKGKQLLTDGGKLSMICPIEWVEDIITLSCELNMSVRRIMYIRGNPKSPVKRIMVEIVNGLYELIESNLLVEDERGEYTEEYKCLTRDFYLKF